MTTATVSVVRSRERIPSGALGMAIFVASETMLFMGFISAFNIVKAGSINWPPANQPRLPVEITGVNTLFLLLSGLCLFLSYKSYKNSKSFEKTFLCSVLLGIVFIAIQGYEWMNLLGHGLTLTSSNYGGFFYLIIGSHAIHAFFALLLMLKVYFQRKQSEKLKRGFLTIQVFWYFVVGMWPLLYVAVYL